MEEVGLSPAAAAVRLIAVWDAALGLEFAPHCRPDGMRNGVIQARVRDSGWMQRLQLEKPRLLARIREALGEPDIVELRFRVGPVEPDPY